MGPQLPTQFRLLLHSIAVLVAMECLGQESVVTSGETGPPGGSSASHDSTAVLIRRLDFKNADLRDVVRAIASKYDLNIYVENGIDRKITVHLVQIPVQQALQFIAERNGLLLERRGVIYHLLEPEIPEPVPEPLDINCDSDLLSVRLRNAPLRLVTESLTRASGRNVVVGQGVQGTVSGFLQSIPFAQGLATLMSVNGFVVRERDGIHLVDKRPPAPESAAGKAGGGNGKPAMFEISVHDSLVSVNVERADIRIVLDELFAKAGPGLVMYDDVKGQVTARFKNIHLNQALAHLLRGTGLSFVENNGIYLIGGKSVEGIGQAHLVRLKHVKADLVMEMVPPELLRQVTLKVI